MSKVILSECSTKSTAQSLGSIHRSHKATYRLLLIIDHYKRITVQHNQDTELVDFWFLMHHILKDPVMACLDAVTMRLASVALESPRFLLSLSLSVPLKKFKKKKKLLSLAGPLAGNQSRGQTPFSLCCDFQLVIVVILRLPTRCSATKLLVV